MFTSGLGLLWQNTGLRRESKLLKECQKLLAAVIDQLEPESSRAAAEFSSLASLLVSFDSNKRGMSVNNQSMSPPAQKPVKSPKKQLQSLKSRSASDGASSSQPAESLSRRATISGTIIGASHRHFRSPSRASLPSENYPAPQQPMNRAYYTSPSMPHEHTQTMSSSAPSNGAAGAMSMADWEFVLSDMDHGYSNIFTGIYGGKECGEDSGPFASLTAGYAPPADQSPMPLSASTKDVPGLSPEAWSASSNSDMLPSQEVNPAPQSVLSLSDESMSTDDRLPYNELQLPLDDLDPFRGIMIPAVEDEIDEFGMTPGWDRRLAV